MGLIRDVLEHVRDDLHISRARPGLAYQLCRQQLRDKHAHDHVEQLAAHTFETAVHSGRVAVVSADRALHGPFSRPAITQIARGGLLHDIGKIAVPRLILDKPGPPTPEERALLYEHPRVGYELAQHEDPVVRFIIRRHHSWRGDPWDRRRRFESVQTTRRAAEENYQAVPLTQLVAAVDCHDALWFPRPYNTGKYPSVSALRDAFAAEYRGEQSYVHAVQAYFDRPHMRRRKI